MDDVAGDFFLLKYSTDGDSNWNTMAFNSDSASTAAWNTAKDQV